MGAVAAMFVLEKGIGKRERQKRSQQGNAGEKVAKPYDLIELIVRDRPRKDIEARNHENGKDEIDNRPMPRETGRRTQSSHYG